MYRSFRYSGSYTGTVYGAQTGLHVQYIPLGEHCTLVHKLSAHNIPVYYRHGYSLLQYIYMYMYIHVTH